MRKLPGTMPLQTEYAGVVKEKFGILSGIL
jgi:hypothetical protein